MGRNDEYGYSVQGLFGLNARPRCGVCGMEMRATYPDGTTRVWVCPLAPLHEAEAGR